MPGFIATCKEAFGGDPRFRLEVRRLARLGGAGDAAVPALEGPSGDSIERSLRELADGPQEERLHACYAGWANSFIVRADGTDVLFAMPRGSLGMQATSAGEGTRHGVIATLFAGSPRKLFDAAFRYPPGRGLTRDALKRR